MAKKHKKSRFKKHDVLRLVGEPVMVAGHVAATTVGGPAATAATAAGAAMVVTWCGCDINDFAKQRKKEQRKNRNKRNKRK